MLSHQSGEESWGSMGYNGVYVKFAGSLGIELDGMRFHSMIWVLGHLPNTLY